MKINTPWESGLLERKTASYSNEDYLKTFVAFANSVRPDDVATVLIGEDDNGNALGIGNADSFQIKIKKIIEKIYPAIVWHPELYEKDGHTCLKIEIKYSGDTPHFGGQAWVRKGSITKPATDEIFQKLVDLRSGKVRELFKWMGRHVTIVGDDGTIPMGPRKQDASLTFGETVHRWIWAERVKIVDLNQFWLTVECDNGVKKSEPLRKATLSFDHETDRLKIIIDY